MTRGAPLFFTVGAGVLVALAIVIGFYIIGSPAQIRRERLDTQRIANLRQIATAITNYHRRHHELPPDLDALRQDTEMALHFIDSETGAAYEYRTDGSTSYELCARFDSLVENKAEADIPWNHQSGRQCFRREVVAAR